MTKHYNKTELKNRRRKLRADMTFCEKIVWTNLRDRRSYGQKFRRQYSVDNFVIDFYCASLKLAVEIDGDVHDEGDQKEYDGNRQEKLEKYGIRFVRIRNEELMENPNMAFKKIEEMIMKLTSP